VIPMARRTHTRETRPRPSIPSVDATRWTPQFRELIDAMRSGAPADVVAELDARAIEAADELRVMPEELSLVDRLALALMIAIDERDWSAARRTGERLRDALDDLRHELRKATSDVDAIIGATDQDGLLRRPEPRPEYLDPAVTTQVSRSTEGADPSSSSISERTPQARTARVHVPPPELSQ